jgi:hypothetical protein
MRWRVGALRVGSFARKLLKEFAGRCSKSAKVLSLNGERLGGLARVVDVFSLDNEINRVFSSGKDEFGLAATISQLLPACDRNLEDVSVLSMMGIPLCRAWSLQSRIGRSSAQPWLVFGTEVESRHGQELLPGIAILPQCGVIDVKEPTCPSVGNPHGVPIGSE